jgi:hypothetical protein
VSFVDAPLNGAGVMMLPGCEEKPDRLQSSCLLAFALPFKTPPSLNQPPPLQADYTAWVAIFGTEAVVKEEQHLVRLSVLGRNPLLLRAWYDTCKEEGVPVRTFGKQTEEELEALVQRVSTSWCGRAGLSSFSRVNWCSLRLGQFPLNRREAKQSWLSMQVQEAEDCCRPYQCQHVPCSLIVFADDKGNLLVFQIRKGKFDVSEEAATRGAGAQQGAGTSIARGPDSALRLGVSVQQTQDEEEISESPRKRLRAEEHSLGDGGADGQSSQVTGNEARSEKPPVGEGTEERIEEGADDTSIGGEERSATARAEQTSISPGLTSPCVLLSTVPSFEAVYAKFLKHPVVRQIGSDLTIGYEAAIQKGRGGEWLSTHKVILLGNEFVPVKDISLVNGRSFQLADDWLAAKPANDLVRLILAQYLEDLKKDGAAFDDRAILDAMVHELFVAKNPCVAGAFCERAVLAKFCRGAGKKLLPFTLSGALPKVFSFVDGQESRMARSLILEAREALQRGAREFVAVLKPTSFAYRYIDVVQIVVRPLGKQFVLDLFSSRWCSVISSERNGMGMGVDCWWRRVLLLLSGCFQDRLIGPR